MAASIFIITRYSVFTPASSGLHLSEDAASPEEYREKLFDAARLDARHEVFDLVTAPSMREQDRCAANVYHLVCVADILPPMHLAKLQNTLQAVEGGIVQPRLCVIASGLSPGNGEAYASVSSAVEAFIRSTLRGQDAAFATVRLDDDDALAPTYCADLARFLQPGFAGLVASFPYGLQGTFDPASRTVVDVRRRYSPNIALGLAHLNFHHADGRFSDPRIHVHGIGSHMAIARSNSVVLSAQRVAFLRTITDYNDSVAGKRHARQPAAFREEIAGFRGLPFGPIAATAEPFKLTDAMAVVSRQRASIAKLKKSVKALQAEVAALRKPA